MEKQPPLEKKGAPETIMGTRTLPRWSARQKHRLKAFLAWLAKGGEHACPT